MIYILTLTGSIFSMQVCDRVLGSQSVPTLLGLSVIAFGAYAFQGWLELMRGRILTLIGEKVDNELAPRVQDVGLPGGVERVAGRRASGSWDTAKWLVEKTHAHVEDGRLVPDSAEAETLFASLGSAPIHVEGARFHAEPRSDLPESGKPPAATAQAVARLWLLSQHQRVQLLECRDLLACRVHRVPGLGQPLNRYAQLGALAHLQQLRDGAGRPSGLRQRQHRRRPPAPLPLRDEEVQVAPRHQGRSLGRPVLDGGGRRDRFARAR